MKIIEWIRERAAIRMRKKIILKLLANRNYIPSGIDTRREADRIIYYIKTGSFSG
jgi:hypothetical protein